MAEYAALTLRHIAWPWMGVNRARISSTSRRPWKGGEIGASANPAERRAQTLWRGTAGRGRSKVVFMSNR